MKELIEEQIEKLKGYPPLFDQIINDFSKFKNDNDRLGEILEDFENLKILPNQVQIINNQLDKIINQINLEKSEYKKEIKSIIDITNSNKGYISNLNNAVDEIGKKVEKLNEIKNLLTSLNNRIINIYEDVNSRIPDLKNDIETKIGINNRINTEINDLNRKINILNTRQNVVLSYCQKCNTLIENLKSDFQKKEEKILHLTEELINLNIKIDKLSRRKKIKGFRLKFWGKNE